MNKTVMELLTKVTLYDLILSLLLISTIIGLIILQKDKLSKVLNKWRKTKNDEDNFHKLVYELKKSFDNLNEQVIQNQKNRDKELLQYRDDSRKIRDEMYKTINSQSMDIKKLTKIITEMQEKDSKTKRAEIKEKIERIYRECHPSMTCTDMQLEVLKELIEEYEEHGGVNSFVHSIVEQEMYEWHVVTKIIKE